MATDQNGTTREFWVEVDVYSDRPKIEFRVTDEANPSDDWKNKNGWFTLRLSPLDSDRGGRACFEIDWIGVDRGLVRCEASYRRKGLPEALMKWVTDNYHHEILSSDEPSGHARRMWERLIECGLAEAVSDSTKPFRFIS